MSHRSSTFSLTPSVKKAWLKELRNPENEQAGSVLYDHGAYCCLGLLCKVNGYSDSEMHHHGYPQNVGFGNDIDNKVPATFNGDEEAYQWSVMYKKRMTPLSELNDVVGLSFAQIADIVERQVQTH